MQEEVEHGAEVRAAAKQQLEENDDEIKKLNTLLLNAKCHAIRDKQLEEKEEIIHHFQDEEVTPFLIIERMKLLNYIGTTWSNDGSRTTEKY